MARKTPSKRAARTEPAADADVTSPRYVKDGALQPLPAGEPEQLLTVSADGHPEWRTVASAEPPARGKLRLRSRVDVMRGKEMRRIPAGEVAASEFSKEELQSLRTAGVVVEG